MRHRITACILAAAAFLPGAAMAQEVYGGVSVHAVDTPFSLETGEGGTDVQIGVRSKPIEGLRAIGSPSAYLHGQASLSGDTSLAAIGLSWKFGNKVYVRPGIGIAVHNDKIREFRIDGRRLDLGSRILFEPEIALGAKLSEKTAVELSWVHVSHARLLDGQNPGMDFIGARLVLKLD
jgi:lipid A 3-O-deacylase